MMSIKCFISFCTDEVREADLRMLVAELKAYTKEEVDYLIYYDKDYGDSLTEFSTKALSAAESCLVLFGPEYKRRIDETIERSGVYQEYDIIVHRLESRSEYKKLRFVPVMWRGKRPDDVLPSYFADCASYLCELTSFRVAGAGSGSPFLPEAIKRQHKDRIGRIAELLLKEAQKHDRELEQIERKTFAVLLDPRGSRGSGSDDVVEPPQYSVEDVLYVKYEHGDYDSDFFRKNYFTRTAFFRRLIDRNIGLISGRKGSGKTTLVQVRENEVDKSDYYPPIDVRVEGWDFHYVVQNIAFKQSESDFEYVALDAKFFDFVWSLFVALCMVESLFRFCDKQPSEIKEVFDRDIHLEEFLKELKDSDPLDPVYHAKLFSLSVKMVREFVEEKVISARSLNEDEFRLDIIQAISVRGMLNGVFGDRMSGLRKLMYKQGNRRFLFCFDRFDSELQRYRKDNVERGGDIQRQRARREIEWLASLVKFVENAQRPDRLRSDREIFEFFAQIKFLVVLPYDRATEIRRHDRDSVAGEPIEQIAWQPLELVTMLRKRIQVLFRVTDDALKKKKNDGPLDRYRRCMQLAGIELPETIPVPVGGKEFRFDLFIEVLRHTFFRPRDVLIYFAAIISRAQAAALRDRKLQIEHCREIISEHTVTVTDLEFIGELKDTWTNIELVLQRFKSKKQALSSRELEEIIGPLDFSFYEGTQSISVLPAKIDYLFRIGFLGFKNPRNTGGYASQNGYQFSFYNPKRIVDFSSIEVVMGRQYAIHPIFIETLSLNVNVEEPVMSLDWGIIEGMDRLE